jgi:hypothetical protein
MTKEKQNIDLKDEPWLSLSKINKLKFEKLKSEERREGLKDFFCSRKFMYFSAGVIFGAVALGFAILFIKLLIKLI